VDNQESLSTLCEDLVARVERLERKRRNQGKPRPSDPSLRAETQPSAVPAGSIESCFIASSRKRDSWHSVRRAGHLPDQAVAPPRFHSSRSRSAVRHGQAGDWNLESRIGSHWLKPDSASQRC